MNPKKLRAFAVALPVTAAVAIGAVRIVADYQAEAGFHPFDSKREMQTNQVLFPDQETASGADSQEQDSADSFWQQDDSNSGGAAGAGSGYLFTPEQTLSPGASTTGTLAQDGAAPTPGSLTADVVYDLVDDAGNADLILPTGGQTIGEAEGGEGDREEETGGGQTPGNGQDPEQPGEDQPVDTKPGEIVVGPDDSGSAGGGTVVTPTTPTEPTPGYGDASIDPPDNKDDATITPTLKYDETLVDDTAATQLFATISQGSYIQLYRGQKSVDQLAVFNTLEAYVTDSSFNQYEFGADSLGKYLRIDGISFNGGQDILDLPVDIPEDATYACLYVSYRFRTDEDWQVYNGYDLDYNQTDYLLYTFAHGRYLILNEILTEEGQQIDPDIILNRYEQYPSVTGSAHLNLFGYLDDFLGPQGTRLTKLFPGWKENGQLVSWFYPLTSGRHVLEPAGQVALDDKYTVEIRRYWMDADGQVDPTATTLSYLQTLTYYVGATSVDENGYATVGTLTVPQYVQAVDFPYYPCLSAGYLDLPDSVIYVNTAGVPSIFDDWLSYDHSLQVTQGYTVAEGNPSYSSEDGILYNKDKTEILGVPTNRRELTVPAGVTKVVLPYQTNLSALHLDFTSVDDLPDINYDRLKRSCKLIVPDDQLDAFLEAENAMLKRTGLSVAPASGYDHTYVVRGVFLFDDQGTICRVLRTDTQWLTLPDGATGVSADALRAMEELTVLILPKDGKALPFASGSLDGLTTLTTIACYSQEQLDAVSASAPAGVKVKLVDAVREDGYSYLITEGGILLLAAPEDLVSFDGTIPMGEGEAPLSIAAVGDNVFENHDSLRWVTLPEGCKMIGYQAFKGCAKLQGVVINDPDFILIGKESFDSCADLRYIASNARTCDLRDWDLALPLGQAYNNPNYTLLFCPTENVGYNSNWVSFTEDSDVVAFAQYDCGGTNLLCGINAAGEPWLGLRSGTDIAGTVTLPQGLEYIFSYAFADAYGANDEAFDLDWTASNGTLANIGVYAFANSDLGVNVTLSEDAAIENSAFQSCRKLKSITIPGQSIIINDNAFYGCYNLESVTFGAFNYYFSLCSGTFSGCSSLRELNFTSGSAPDLSMSFFTPGSKYYFNADSWSSFEAEEAALTIHVPEGCEEDYVAAWRYFMAGYVDLYYMTAYQSMWSTIQDSLTDFENNILPENDAVFAEVDRQLLAAENHIRALLDVAPADHLERAYTYTVDEDGNITLTAVKGLGFADLTAESMDMPYGWALDYIAPGAFALSPDIQLINLPDNLAGIYDGAFTGITTESLSIITMAETPPALLGFETGTPFSFGIDDMYIDLSLISWSDMDAMQASYVRAWLFPMAGYHDMDEMRAAVAAALEEKNGAAPTDEEVTAAVMTQLLEAENRVRELVGMDIISDTEDMIGLTEPDPEPDWPDLPDWPEWPDETDPEWPEWPDETDPALPEGGEETETPEEPGETQEPDETGDDQNTPDPDGSDDDASAPADDMTGETEEGQTGPEEEQA